MWDGLRSSRLRTLNFRTELNAGFAADGYARVSGRVAPLLISTGPGALNALTAIMEAASAHVPVVAIASQIPSDMIGKRRGYLHELHGRIDGNPPRKAGLGLNAAADPRVRRGRDCGAGQPLGLRCGVQHAGALVRPGP